MDKPHTLSTFEFFKRIPDEEAARKLLEARRWGDTPVCGHCGSISVSETRDHRPMPYRCRDCRKHFSVRTGSVLAESRLPLQKWLLAIYMLTSARRGIPSTQMARELGITQKSAWFLAQRIRETWLKDRDDHMGGQTQINETYVCGRGKNKHAKKKLHAGRGAVSRAAVVGIRDKNGEVGAVPVEDTKAATLLAFVRHHAVPPASIVIDHHGDGIESFWALLKRGHYGIHRYMTTKHLYRYVQRFSFRHNTARVGKLDSIGMTIARMANEQLTYRRLINA